MMETPASDRPAQPPLLPPCPPAITRDGGPATGTYAGIPHHMDWNGLSGSFRRSTWWRRFHHKRWHYLGLGNAECFVGMAIVDVGWTNTAFVYVFDRRTGQLLVDASQDGLPGLTASVADLPLADTPSWFRFGGMDLRIDPVGPDGLNVFASVKNRLQLQVRVSPMGNASAITAIGPIKQGGCAHATVKSTAMRVQGSLLVSERSIRLDDAWASFDYSNGLLARETQWRWASGHSPEVGFNLQEGYFGKLENVLWLQGHPIRLGAARFEFDPAHPLRPWKIRTEDGLLDLTFQPEGARQERKNLLVASSYYIQPVGTFRGQVRASADALPVVVDGLLGVTEDHQSKW